MKKRRLILIFAVLIGLVVLEATLLAQCAGSRSQDSADDQALMTPSPTTQLILTPAPTDTAPPPTASPVPSAAPTATPIPAAEPTETPETPETTATAPPAITPLPTATPSYGTIVAQGSFTSDTGTAMNLSVSWVAFDVGDGTAVVAVTGSVYSYSLQTGPLYDGVQVDFAGYSATADTNSIWLEENNYTVSPLFYTTVTVPLGTAGTMDIAWRYGGTYGETVLDTVTASGYVNAG